MLLPALPKSTRCQELMLQLPRLLSKSVITAPIIGATKPEHLSTAISALDFSLSDAEITELEVRYLPHPVDGIIPPLPDTPPSLTPPSAIQNY